MDDWEDRQVLCWCGMQASSDNAQSIIENAVDEASMHTTTPNWPTVLSCGVKYAMYIRAEMCNVLASAPNSDPTSCHNSVTQVESLFTQSLEAMTESE